MRTDLSAVLITVSLILAVWAIAVAVLDKRLNNWLIYGMFLLEALILLQLAVAIVGVARGDGPSSAVTVLAYAAGALLVPPAGLFWSLADRSRSSVLVITVACLAVPVMTARMLQLWGAVRG